MITCWKNNLIKILCLCPTMWQTCEEKDDFYSVLISSISTISPRDVLIVHGGLNSHIDEDSDGFKDIHGAYGCGIRNAEGTRIPDVQHYKPCSCKLLIQEEHIQTYHFQLK